MAKELSGFLEELKYKCEITDVIGTYVPLAQKGRNHWGRCPFHHEKTPSFAVNPDDQYYHCFGCGESGDVIKFVQSIESVDFMTAVNLLCDKSGLKMPQNLAYEDDKSAQEKRQRDKLYEMLKAAAKYYHATLMKSGAEVINYLNRRGITNESIKRFGIGYSKDYDGLIKYLQKMGYSQEEMLIAGAAAQSEKGRFYDPLGTRVIIPVINSFGDVVAFGGRDITGNAFAKYRNTAESKLFNKSKNLYAINLVKRQKQEKGIDSILVVEGYMDVIALHQAGLKNSVASMGTALTKEQARLIKRFTPEALICFDGDAAGQAATMRGLDILRGEGLNVRVIALPDNLDPDDYIKKYGREKFDTLMRKAMPLPDFKLFALRQKYDLSESDGRRKYIRESIDVAAKESDSAVREELLKDIGKYTGITYESLKRELDSRSQKTDKQSDVPVADIMPSAGSNMQKALRFILGSAVKGRTYASDYANIQQFIESDTHLKILAYIDSCRREGKPCRPSALFEVTTDGEHNEVGAVLESMERIEKDMESQYYRDCMDIILSEGYEKKLKMLAGQFEQETDINVRRDIALKIQALAQEQKKR